MARRLGEVPTHFTKPRNSSSKPDRSATRDMVVLSPPGMMSASHFCSSAGVRTSVNVHCVGIEGLEGGSEGAALWRRVRCSKKAPWSASTPTVMGVIDMEAFIKEI